VRESGHHNGICLTVGPQYNALASNHLRSELAHFTANTSDHLISQALRRGEDRERLLSRAWFPGILPLRLPLIGPHDYPTYGQLQGEFFLQNVKPRVLIYACLLFADHPDCACRDPQEYTWTLLCCQLHWRTLSLSGSASNTVFQSRNVSYCATAKVSI